MSNSGTGSERTLGSPQLSIIVVSYNTREETLACLASVVAETRRVSYELIVVDNASEDGSAQAIADRFPDVKLLALTENVGFARGNNIGADQATGDHLLLLNPDTIILDGAIDKLWSFALSTPSAGIWGSRTLRLDGTLDPTCCFGRLTLWSQICQSTGLSSAFSRSSLFNPEAYAGWQRDSVRNVDVIAGCYLLITRNLWRSLDGFDPAFFMYGEEQDLCLRARRFGAHPLFTPDATIIHIGGASERTRAGKMIKLLAAKTMLMQRYFVPALVPPGRLVLAMWPLTRLVSSRVRAWASPNERNRDEAKAWAEIWSARKQWRNGFSSGRMTDHLGLSALPVELKHSSTGR